MCADTCMYMYIVLILLVREGGRHNFITLCGFGGVHTACLILQSCPSSRLVSPIAHGIQTSKSAVTRKSCAEFLAQITNMWDTNVLDRAGSTIEDTIVKGLKDSDANARKHMRRYCSVCL